MVPAIHEREDPNSSHERYQKSIKIVKKNFRHVASRYKSSGHSDWLDSPRVERGVIQKQKVGPETNQQRNRSNGS